MAYFVKLLIFCFALSADLAFAGFAQLKPPAGWSAGGSALPGKVGSFKFPASANAANDASFKGSTVLTNAALAVGGQLVTVPVALRVAANAATLAAEFSFGNPLLFAGLLAGGLAAGYYATNYLTLEDNKWVKTEKSSGSSTCTVVLGNGVPFTNGSCELALAAGLAASHTTPGYSIDCQTSVVSPSTPCRWKAVDWWAGWSAVQATLTMETPPTTITRPATLDDFKALSQNAPVPDAVMQELPIDWPVQVPTINPDANVVPPLAPNPALDPDPYFDPNILSRPYIVPTGLPVPTADPNVFNQPGVKITPAPTAKDPWRVDATAVDVPQDSAKPKTDAELNPVTPPATTPKKDGLGLCDQYPNIEACAPAKKEFCEKNPKSPACLEVDAPDLPDIETKNKDISITPDSGWGADGGACPASRKLSHAEFSFQPYCDFATGIHPAVIAAAWLAAAVILVGATRGGD